MRALRTAVVLVLALALPAPVLAADLQAGAEAYDRGDYATALIEFRPLAEQGNANAQHALGVMYSKGRGVPQNHAEAVKWWRLAAEQGKADAQLGLGAMYFYGRGAPQDYAEAVKWYRLAAEQGQADAQIALGFMYYFGHGVPQDYVQAHMWYSLAAERSSPGEDRDQLISYRDEVEAKMSPDQVAEAQRLAREWKPK